MISTQGSLTRLAWQDALPSLRTDDARPGTRTASVLTELQIHSQSVAISRSQRSRRVLWISMLIIHITVGTSSLVFTGLYSYLSLTNAWFVDVARMFSVRFDHTVAFASAILSGLCACLHWCYAVDIISRSLKNRRQSVVKPPPTISNGQLSMQTRTLQFRSALLVWLDSIGVRGRSFESALLAREVFSVAIQSVQCYRFSRLIARNSLNRLVSGLLVINCISTPLLQVLGRKRRLVLLRLACLLVDAFVDLAVSFAVPLVVVIPQFLLYVHPPGGVELLFDDPVWYSQVHNELNMMLINSWISCLAQYVPAMTLLQSMDDIKSLIRRRPRAHANRNGPKTPRTRVAHKTLTTRVTQVGLLLHGCFMFTVHMYAVTPASTTASSEITGCQLFLHPWFTTRVACAVVMVDCKKSQLNGSALEVEDFIRNINPDAINAITFAHCPRLDMPHAVQNMSRLLVLEFYNTTIAEWDEDTGLDVITNPSVTRVLIIQCSLAPLGHVVPRGLLHNHSPPSLDYLIMTDTLLHEFPVDFDKKWPPRMASLQCNKCGLATLPHSFFAVQVSYKTSLADNNLTSLPDSFFSAPGPKRINLNNNQIDQVPSLINATGLVTLSMQRNLIQELDVTNAPASLTTVAVGGTPYCGGRPSFQVVSHANVSCEVLDDALFTFPTAAWVALREME